RLYQRASRDSESLMHCLSLSVTHAHTRTRTHTHTHTHKQTYIDSFIKCIQIKAHTHTHFPTVYLTSIAVNCWELVRISGVNGDENSTFHAVHRMGSQSV